MGQRKPLKHTDFKGDDGTGPEGLFHRLVNKSFVTRESDLCHSGLN